MKAVFDKETHYYKYVYNEWTQPTLTSNGSFGGNSMAVTAAFGGNNGQDNIANTYTIFKPNTGRLGFYCDEWQSWMEVRIYLPNPTKLTTLTFMPVWVGDSSGGAYNTKLYAGNYIGSKEVLVQDIGTVGENSTYNNTSLPTNDYYQYYTLFCNNGGWAYEDALHLQNMYVAGQARTVIEGTASDYDYKIEGGKTYIVQDGSVRKYYKYDTVGITWKQPVLSANGTLGGDNFACYGSSQYSSYYPLYALNNDNSNANCWMANGQGSYFIFYNPTPICVTKIKIYNRNNNNVRPVSSGTVYGSNDNSTYTELATFSNGSYGQAANWDININNSSYYKYYKIVVYGTTTMPCIGEMSITATEPETIVVDGTSEDYDFYKDVDIYKAIKSYTKGQYYGN